MLLAVLQRRAGVNLAGLDCYVSTVGGVKLTEPSTDLAVAMALASAAQDRPLPQRLVCFGEVGLAGEVRPVPGIGRRIQEVARLGFTHAVVPASPTGPGPVPAGFTVREVTTISDAMELLFPRSAAAPARKRQTAAAV
jgi:DNA repair protein RadA/Sms